MFKSVALAAVMVVLACGVAHAAGDGHEIPWMNFFLRVLNTVIVVAIIWKFGGKAIAGFFRGRTDQIKHELEDLAQRRKDAEVKLKDVEKGIANLEAEKAQILAEARSQGEAMKAAIVAEAEKKAAQIKAAAEMAAETERKVMIEQIREEVAEMVVQTAASIIKDKLTAEEHQKLVDKYVTKVVLN